MSPWRTTPLSGLATCLDSQRVPVKGNDRQQRLGTVPYYGANGQVGWIDEALFNESLLLIPEDGGHFDEPLKGVAYTISGPAWVNNHAHVLRVDSNKVLLEFLGYHFRHFDFRPYITGTTRAKLTQRDLMRVEVPLPPLAEQERIVKLLDETDVLRKLRAQADRRAADLIPALFHEMFGDPEHTRYPVKPLIELVSADRPITYGILKPGPEIRDGIPYVRVLDIKQHRLHVDQLQKTSKEIANQYRRSTLSPGDLLITIRGTVGRTCIVPEELKGANITQDTARLAIVAGIALVYVMEFLNTPWAQSWMAHHTQGQAVKGINLGDLKKLPVPVPPLGRQKDFTERVVEIRALEAEQAASGRRLDDLFRSMLHRAFSGEL